MNTKKIFLGGINSDDSSSLVDSREYLGAFNIRITSSENNQSGIASNIEGNTGVTQTINSSGALVTWSLPSGTNKNIGSYEDETNKRIYFFNKNTPSGNHGIYCYDYTLNIVYTVILNSQVTNGLGFANVNYIDSIAMLENILVWTDGVNEQKRINVEAAIKANHPTYSTTVSAYTLSPAADFTLLTLAKPQPAIPLIVSKYVDSSYANNLVANEAFQFSYRFVYRDYEISCLSPLSTLINYNSKSENASGCNSIKIKIPLDQKILQDVQRIEIVAKYIVGGKSAIIRVYDRDIDSALYTSHNSGTAIEFIFYNDVVGLAIDDASSVKQFDAIPIKSKSLEIARNRLFLANNTDGYQSPTVSSLTTSFTTVGSGSLVGLWWTFKWIDPSNPSVTETRYLLEINGMTGNNGFYYNPPTWPVWPTPSYPGTLAYSSFVVLSDFLGYTYATIAAFFGIDPAWIDTLEYNGNQTTITGATSSSLADIKVFKSDSTYRLGVVFYDYAGRKCGVVTKDNSNFKKTTPDRTYNSVTYTSTISWSLSNAGSNLLDEIPSWAYYYAVVMTKCLRTSFFFQAKADSFAYVSKTAAGDYSFNATTYSSDFIGLAVKAKTLYGYGLGYSYQEGDIMKLYLSPAVAPKSLKVKDTYSDYIIVDLADIGNLTSPSTVAGLFELYTPYAQSFNEFYYERGQSFKITNPGTSSRIYSTLFGSFSGDVNVLDRAILSTNYFVEAMSPNDLFWQNWYSDTGRPNIVSTGKQMQKKINLCFSNNAILGTEINGISTFDALDYTDMPYELSSIRKLMLVSKIESQGTVMLVIGEQETASLYLGEAQLFDNGGNSFVAKTAGVIGNVNILRGGYGTIHPESAVRYAGQVYWFDASWGAVIRYDNTGLFPVSSYKMHNFFKKLGNDALKYSGLILSGIDPYHEEILMYFPRISYIPKNTLLKETFKSVYQATLPVGDNTIPIINGRAYMVNIGTGSVYYNSELIGGLGTDNVFIADESTTINLTHPTDSTMLFTMYEIERSHYEPYDGQGGTWCFGLAVNKWTSRYSYRPEGFSTINNRLVTFKSGKPYVHNSSTLNNFYGTQFDSVLAVVHSELGSTIKTYNSITIEGDVPDFVHIRTEIPNVQSSSVISSEFSVKEGVGYAPVLRDVLSPNAGGTYDQNLFKGDVMRGEFGKLQLSYNLPSVVKKMKFFSIGTNISRGHNKR